MYKPSQEELNNGLEAVGYEIERLCNIFDLLRSRRSASDPDGGQSYLVAFLLHARNLWDFYTRSKRHTDCRGREQDTMLCADYAIQCDDLPSIRGPLSEDRDYKERLDKWLAHLTHSRPSFDHRDRGWPVIKIFIQLTNLSIEFCRLLMERYELDSQTTETEKETWQTRKAKVERLNKASKQLPPGSFTNSRSVTTEIQVDLGY